MKVAELVRSRGFAIAAAAVLALVVAGGSATWFALAPAGRSIAGGEALVGGPFTLTDQHGAQRTEHDFAGRSMLSTSAKRTVRISAR
jgi:cytochrome oxidase Cu insertion factor (SCO1/SenC/PrrC family)